MSHSGSDASAGERIRRKVADVLDPEVPVLTIEDLGILRDVRLSDDEVVVVITPTYSGCPAMDAIRSEIGKVLEAEGVASYRIETVLSPAWTTDWISQAGKEKLAAYGIVPPVPTRDAGPVLVELGPPRKQLDNGGTRARAASRDATGWDSPGRRSGVVPDERPRCPACGSGETEQLSRFGSTACKALWRCRACREPFEYFKAL